MKAMVLSAGLGTRFRPHTEILPKPALPFLNIPLIYYPIYLTERYDLTDVVVNTHHLADELMPALRSYPEMNFKLHLSHEAEKVLGSGGGLGLARSYFKGSEDFVLVNGDEVILPSSARVMTSLLNHHRTEGALATLLVMKHPGVGSEFGGVWSKASGEVVGFGKTAPPSSELLTGFHFTGLQILSERVLAMIPRGESNIFYDILTTAIAKGEKVQVVEDPCTWFETGHLKAYLQATKSCLERLRTGQDSAWLKEIVMRYWPDFSARRCLWEGQQCHHHFENPKAQMVLMGDRVKVHGSVQVKGFAVLGSDVVIGKDCVLENCVVRSGLKVPPGTQLRDNLFLDLGQRGEA